MAIITEPAAPGPSNGTAADRTTLRRLADTNTYEGDWSELRGILHRWLDFAVDEFLSKGPRRPNVPGQPSSGVFSGSSYQAESSTSGSAGTEPGDGSARAPSSVSPVDPSDALDPSDPTLPSNTSTGVPPELLPSSPGGLVIPPFPPLDPNRTRRFVPSFWAGRGMAPTTAGKVNGHIVIRGNFEGQGGGGEFGGAGAGGMVGPGGGGGMNTMGGGEDYEEDVVIGGKMLPGWMENGEARSEGQKVAKMLDEFDFPPFTIQRLAELSLNPCNSYSTLGKFLRAYEKNLLVTTPWETPSYTYTAPSTLPTTYLADVETSSFSSISAPSPSASSSVSEDDEESMMPPRPATPMFSPIPFLARTDMDVESSTSNGQAHLEEGLMSPLTLMEGSPNPSTGSFQPTTLPGMAGSVNQGRSPTPEPEDKTASPGGSSASGSSAPQRPPRPIRAVNRPASKESGPTTRSGADAEETMESNPDLGHQSYLGRVDELDTGPVATSDGVERDTKGAGEGGNMVQHGMSEKPVALSSTTTMKEEATEGRKFAALPKSLSERFVSGQALEATNEHEDDTKEEVK